MKDAFEKKGYWYISSKQDNKVAGTLQYTPGKRITLDLIGSFDTLEDFFLNSLSDRSRIIDIIHGESSGGEKITLLKCFQMGASLHSSCAFPMQTFTASFLLMGIHLEGVNDSAFNQIEISYLNLTSWMNKYMLEVSIPFKNNIINGFEFKLNYDNIELISVDLKDDIQLTIEYNCSHGYDYSEEFSISQNHNLNFVSGMDKSLFTMLKLAKKFQNFLTFASLSPINFSNINLYSPVNSQDSKKGEKIYPPIGLYFTQDDTQPRKIKIYEFLFTYEIISPYLSEILNKWFSFDDEMDPIIQHLIESIQPKTFFSKADFLVVIQALEGFHTRFRNIEKVNLKDRLIMLYQEFSFIPSIDKIKIDYKIATDSRHYYSHFFHRSKKEHIADGEELFYLTRSLRILLMCCVLKATDFNDETISLIMNDCEKLLRLH